MEFMNLFFLAVLIALTAFFVATEFAIIRVRPSRVEQLISEGRNGARAAKEVISHLDEYLSACQLGITVTALGLGWLGEPTIENLLHPLFEVLHLNEDLTNIVSFIIAFVIVTFLHVVIGELAPKTVAIQKAETVTLLFSKPIIWFSKIMFPFIWALNGAARLVTRMFGLEPASEHEVAHSEEELRFLLSESYESGEINQTEMKYVNNIFEFDERVAREIMVPRTEIVTLSIEDDMDTILDVIRREQYTRYPVVKEDKDHILGLVNIKRILTAEISGETSEFRLSTYVRPIIQVLETVPIQELLVAMQKQRVHMAILYDEYGGTSGLVTVEDILEEIVGEIRDEFDAEEVPEVRKVKPGQYIFEAKISLRQVNEILGTSLSEENVETLGGWFLAQRLDVKRGDEILEGQYVFTVKEVEGHHIYYIEAKTPNTSNPDGASS
ncbi:hemolysin family protein [Peribacillus sp. SCS-155]|uniref:hemolysin family protein n=1 Tax=Peribacillus sedimenti TaxID=3115297 RepID=UPI0039057C39